GIRRLGRSCLTSTTDELPAGCPHFRTSGVSIPQGNYGSGRPNLPILHLCPRNQVVEAVMKMTGADCEQHSVRHIAVPRTGDDFFATGEFERDVTVWSLKARKCIGVMRTILDFGGTRLAVPCADRPFIITGSWRKGVAAYEGTTGGVLWSRKDLKNVQQVCDLSDNGGLQVGIGLDNGP